MFYSLRNWSYSRITNGSDVCEIGWCLACECLSVWRVACNSFPVPQIRNSERHSNGTLKIRLCERRLSSRHHVRNYYTVASHQDSIRLSYLSFYYCLMSVYIKRSGGKTLCLTISARLSTSYLHKCLLHYQIRLNKCCRDAHVLRNCVHF